MRTMLEESCPKCGGKVQMIVATLIGVNDKKGYILTCCGKCGFFLYEASRRDIINIEVLLEKSYGNSE